MSRIAQSPGDLIAQLRDQVELLEQYSILFDAGKLVMAKPMATSLRVLLHDVGSARSKTKSLLGQLGLRNRRWRDSAAISRDIQQSSCSVVTLVVQARMVHDETTGELVPRHAEAFCQPILKSQQDGLRRTMFHGWWNDAIAYSVDELRSFSRKDLVLHVAETDGGAHVDGSLDASYLGLRNGGFLGIRGFIADDALWMSGGMKSEGDLIPGLPASAIRTIAHETVLTIKERMPDVFQPENLLI